MQGKDRRYGLYRCAVLALALGYAVYQMATGNWSSFGGPLRYLTNWALLASVVSAAAMVGLAFGADRRGWMEAVAAVAAVMNAVVVIQYWRLYLDDPGKVNNAGPIAWWLEYYLHLLGPLLQWIDALLLFRAFRHHIVSLVALLGLVAAYALWCETLVGPRNDAPVGQVTSGLPYPFLNDMEVRARLIFYAINGAVVVVLYTVFAGIATLSRRLRG